MGLIVRPILLVIPSYRETDRLSPLLLQIEEELRRSPLPAPLRIIVADDGSPVEESRMMNQTVATFSAMLKTQVFDTKTEATFRRFENNRGKGAVLRDIFKEAIEQNHYEALAFLDADGATPFSQFKTLLSTLLADPDLAATIGSRWLALGHEVFRSPKRHYIGRVFATLLSTMFRIPVYDSQCGAKIFRTNALTLRTFEICTNPRWLFDTELLVFLWLEGRKLEEVPVNWHDIPGSKVSLIRDPLRMLLGLWRFKKKLIKLGVYPPKS